MDYYIQNAILTETESQDAGQDSEDQNWQDSKNKKSNLKSVQ